MDFLLYIIVVVVFPMIASLADWTNSIAALIYRYIQEREKKRFFCFVLMTVIERENNQKDRSSYITLNDSSSFHFPRAAEVKVAYCPWTALSLILIDGAPHNPDHL